MYVTTWDCRKRINHLIVKSKLTKIQNYNKIFKNGMSLMKCEKSLAEAHRTNEKLQTYSLLSKW